MITIDQLNEQAKLVTELRSEEAEISRKKKEVSERLEHAENKMLELLEAAYPDEPNPKFHSPFGTAYVSNRTSVRLPQGEDKDAFDQYLSTIGMKEELYSINSMRLNKFYKDQFELARERGQSDFEIPGLKDITINKILGFRKN